MENQELQIVGGLLVSKSVDAILACRNGGSRLYGKPVQPLVIGNMTILDSLIQYIRAIHSIRNIILAIAEGDENRVFVQYADNNSLPYAIGEEEDVLGRLIKAAGQYQTHYVFRTTTECPFVLYEYADSLIKEFFDGDYDWACYEETPEGTGFEVIKTEALKACHERGEKKHRSELVTLYIFENQEEFKLLKMRLPQELCRPEVRLTVDYAEDLVFCQKVYSALRRKDRLIRVEEIIKFWDEHPDLRKPMEEIGIDWGHGRLWK
jgi:spore coat polysaccharide biosynthesis protein SpsF